MIAAGDAATDPRTREFLDPYLRPHRHRRDARRAAAAEQQDGRRALRRTRRRAETWTVDEQNFAISTANLIAVALADEELHGGAQRAGREQGARPAHRRHGARRVHRRRFGRPHRRVERAGGADVRLDASRRPWAGASPRRSFRRASARRTRTACERFHDTGEAPVVNKRLELTALHRSGHEFPIEITITRRCG